MSDLRGSALVCTENEALQAAVKEAGFVVTAAPTCEQALPHVRHDQWTLIALDQTTGRETLTHLHSLPGVRRRELYVILLDDRFETGDRFQAWSESVELVLHSDDLPNLRRLVGDGMKDKAEFYRRFNEVRNEPGARLGAHA